ncbi:VWA domain-containing protein [uncultured Croceitalea sp.]|uniref:VWA domain-containing protein n=1 Tax=uncultured Croceitalea sp. TaxID=1798908 RepID=UPI0033061569
MQATTILLITLGFFGALLLAWYQYLSRKKWTKLGIILALLRFGLLFSLFLLLIGPEFKKNTYTISKPNLVLAVDNSSSIREVGGAADLERFKTELNENSEIAERFSLQTYLFGDNLSDNDSLTFNATKTNITEALSSINDIHKGTTTAIVLLTDGNQTLGIDYEFMNLNKDIQVYPVVLGDTTQYEDIRIGQVNSNKYAFIKNQFPIEFDLTYSGKESVSTIVRIRLNGQQVFRQNVQLSNSNNSVQLSTLLEAKSVGLKNLTIEAVPLDGERNTNNNKKNIAIEVIDEKTKVTIVSSIMHPDIGMLKKSIESNEQRTVTIVKPTVKLETLEETDVFILYQPNPAFKSLYEYVQNKGTSLFTVTGPKTNWAFLNQIQNTVTKEDLNEEEVAPHKNSGFGLFDMSNFELIDYPPIASSLGTMLISKPYETVAYQRIKGVSLNEPLFFLVDNTTMKEAFLLGENSWKWRVEAYRNTKSFKAFDDFMAKVILFLSQSKRKSRLELSYESVYEGARGAIISASYFDKAYLFNANASISLKVKRIEPAFEQELPMLMTGSSYEVDLSGLEAGEYTFTATVKDENISKSGTFRILDFDVEKQFLSADFSKLNRFAATQNSQLFYSDELDGLLNELNGNERFVPTQKSTQNVVSLIDFRVLLVAMVFFAALEWYIRKYNGLL